MMSHAKKLLVLALVSCILVITSSWNLIRAQLPESTLPPLQVHSLPNSLATWQPKQDKTNYFANIKPSHVGYLIWSEFPVQIYVQRPTESPASSASAKRQHQWLEAVLTAIKDWNVYLPLVEVTEPEKADIIINRSPPAFKVKRDPETGLIDIPRARVAETSYKFYIPKNSKILTHRMTIQIDPGLAQSAILAAARHELGHGLGIWGHSPIQTDTMYFSQLADSPIISERDLNTLKKIYQQPTRLGWNLPLNHQ